MSVGNSFLNKYDLLGKSLPGAVLVTGVYLFLPAEPAFGVSQAESQFEIIFRLLGVLLVGLLIGELVHTLSTLVEKAFMITGSLTGDGAFVIREQMDRFIVWLEKLEPAEENGNSADDDQPDASQEQPDTSDNGGTAGEHSITDRLRTAGIELCIAAIVFSVRVVEAASDAGKYTYKRFYPVFQQHRRIFELWMKNHYAPSEPIPWSPGDMPKLKTRFNHFFDEKYSIKLQKQKPTTDIYPMVTSAVGGGNHSISQRFQNLYSFSRSMWTVLLILLLWYSMVSYGLYDPWWSKNPPIWPVFPLVFGVVVFMYASSRYKQVYVEYLVSDFVNCESERNSS